MPHTPPATAGLTLVELLVTISVLAIALAAIVPSLLSQTHANSDSQRRTQAISAIRQVVDRARLIPPATLPSSGSAVQTVTVGGTAYTVTTTYCPTTAPACTPLTRGLNVTARDGTQTIASIDTAFTSVNSTAGN